VAWATLTPGVTYTLQLTLKGASASLTVNGAFALSMGYNSSTVDGRLGLATRSTGSTFRTIRIRANDPSLAAVAAALTASAAGPGTGSAALAPDLLAAALVGAQSRWAAYGLAAQALALVRVQVGELPGLQVAEADGSTITVDARAAGWGWAQAGVAGGLDLVAVLAHEVGHVLGLGHDEDGVMAATIRPATSATAVASAHLAPGWWALGATAPVGVAVASVRADGPLRGVGATVSIAGRGWGAQDHWRGWWSRLPAWSAGRLRLV
jgi:hypothetical protein